MIHRQELIRRFNPTLKECDLRSPLTVGNGDFAFTADVTGLQTFAEEYAEGGCPLLTQASGFWHMSPDGNGNYPSDLKITLTEYARGNRTVKYPTECFPGEREAYDALRRNPHRFNLMRLSFLIDENAQR